MTEKSSAAILPIPLVDALGDRYLSYALSTITARSLPDVRDGLKPVHRRLLYAMRQLRLEPGQPPKKSARVVGDVIGKFHPHGDTAVYDALVRLAQDFAQRYPLVDGQGNFGNIDGDNAAAMRYTEARLTDVAEALLEGIDEDAVDLRDTYDGEGSEPVVLPAAFPNLLANGAQGIAVGMATSIPPHNVHELCDALLHLIDRPDAEVDELIALVPGPDFPTGGILIESADGIRDAYRTGRGGFRLRARWVKEPLGQGQYQVVVTEVPWQVPKAKLVERIAELIHDKKVPLLDDVRDESTDEIRLVLMPKSRNVDPDVMMEQLFRLTDLETRVPLNLNVLDAAGVPRVMNLKETLVAFLDHRLEVLIRRSRHRLGRIEHRLEVVAGYLVAYLNLDEVIRIIREEDDPKAEIMNTFSLSEVQTEAILNMRLRALRRLEEMEIRREHSDLTEEKTRIEALLASDQKQHKVLAFQIRETITRFGRETALGRRRTEIGVPPSAVIVPLEAFVEREPITVYLSQKGWIRAVSGHRDDADIKYKEGDRERFILKAETTDRLLVFATDGRFYTLGADRLPRGRGFGEPMRLMVDLGTDVDVVALLRHDPAGALLVASSDGRGFRLKEVDALAQTRAGRQVLNVETGVEAQACVPVRGDQVAVLGENRKLLVFPVADLPEMGRGRGVMLQKYAGGGLSDVVVFSSVDGLSWGHRTITGDDLKQFVGRRGSTGRMVPKGYPRGPRFQ